MDLLCPILGRVTRVRPTAFRSGEWQVVRCEETGFVFLANPPSYEALTSEHAWEVTSAAEKERRKSAEPLLSKLSLAAARLKLRLFPRRNRFFTLAQQLCAVLPDDQPMRILDIGCAAADLLQDLQGRFAAVGRGIIPLGIEVSAHLARLAHQTCAGMGGRVVFANAVDGAGQFSAESVDLVIMSSFLEHEAQPLVLLKKLHRVLSRDGMVVLKVPNFACVNRVLRGGRWCGFRYPDHVNYFTPTTLRRLALESGFEVSQGFLDCLPTSDTMYAVLRKAAAAKSAAGSDVSVASQRRAA
jgi:SAM-dependent methyltransferase